MSNKRAVIEVSTEVESKKINVSGEFSVPSWTKAKDFDSKFKDWGRPMAKALDANKDNLVFQQIEVEESGKGTKEKSLLLLMYGITESGNSVLCQVKDFYPYCYIPAPVGFRESDLEGFEMELAKNIGMNSIKEIKVVQRKSIYGYQAQESAFIMIYVTAQSLLKTINDLFHKGRFSFGSYVFSQQTFESNMEYVLRFMIDTKILGGNWVELKAGDYNMIPENYKISRCQYEVEISFDKIISYAPEGEYSSVAPLRVMSFDIECAGRKGIFPEPNVDRVIQIACVVKVQGREQAPKKIIFCLNTCSSIGSAQVLCFEKETDMLEAFAYFLRTSDPDMMIGYNIIDFDIDYLIKRASHLKLEDFPYLGRLKNKSAEVISRTSSGGQGMKEFKICVLNGRLVLDIMLAIRKDFNLRSYTLNSVSTHFLGDTKNDIHYSIITDLFLRDSESRRRLAEYCLKDAELPLELMDKLMFFYNYLEMARVTGVPFNYLVNRGQQIKVISQLYRKSRDQGYVIPHLNPSGSGDKFEGATVIDPEKGFYRQPIATLDFASLYPSIMIAHNLCYSTLIIGKTAEELARANVVEFKTTPNNNIFVEKSTRMGLLPEILQDLLAARKRAKADLKKEKDPFKKAVLDGRQLALKLSSNSVYGFTGATNGVLPCLEISASVTSYGRQMIMLTKEHVEKTFKGAHVIYGDTDSVMVDFNVGNDLNEVMKTGRRAAEEVSKIFINPINLEFEKVYFPYLLFNKKRYAGLYWTNPDKPDKLDSKGIETVRRDNCPLVSTMIEKCLHLLLKDNDPDGAVRYAKETIKKLLMNKIDLQWLIITRTLSKANYSTEQPHTALAARMEKRDPGSAPGLGDRVPYVVIQGTKSQVFERSEDPLYVLKHSIPLDYKYYLENQLQKPLERIFEPILGEKTSELFSGEHTKNIKVSYNTNSGLGIKLEVVPRCMNCSAPLKSDGDLPVCYECEDEVQRVYLENLGKYNSLVERWSRAWSQCQRCQKTEVNEIICTNGDCPIYYLRFKAQLDSDLERKKMHRFDSTWYTGEIETTAKDENIEPELKDSQKNILNW